MLFLFCLDSCSSLVSSIVGSSDANAFPSSPGDRMPSDVAYELGRDDTVLCDVVDQRASWNLGEGCEGSEA